MVHDVTFDLPTRDLGKSDIHFHVKVDGVTLGKLEVSKGSLVWYPNNTTYGHKMTWTEFHNVMQNRPQSERRKRK